MRASVGVIAGLDEHNINIVYLGDGARYALKDVDRSDALKYLDTLSRLGYNLKVEKESLLEGGITEDEISEDIKRRGLGSRVANNVEVIDYSKLVDLIIENKVVNFA